MLSIEYYLTSQGSRLDGGQLYESPIDRHVPEWMELLARPNVRQMESWQPLLGDSKHVVHVVTSTSTWTGRTAIKMVDKLVATGEPRAHFEQLRNRHGTGVTWTLELTVKTMKRIPRTDPEYVKQMQEMHE